MTDPSAIPETNGHAQELADLFPERPPEVSSTRTIVRDIDNRRGQQFAELRVQPSNITAERCALGSAILCPNALETMLTLTTRQDFYHDVHRLVFDGLAGLRAAGVPVDAVTLADELSRLGTLEDVGGIPSIVELMEAVPHAAHIANYCRTIIDSRKRREAIRLMEDSIHRAFDPTVDIDETVAGIEGQLTKKRRAGLIMRTAGELVRQFPNLRPAIIEGVLRSGETMNIIAASKFGKSWLMLLLAFSVACGPRKWLNKFWTTRGRVLYVDNELHEETSAHRLSLVAESMGLREDDWSESLTVINLRGELLDLADLSAELVKIEPGEFSLIVLDAWYRFQPEGSDENANRDVMALYNLLDSVAARIGSAFVCVHHSSKGDQSGKAIVDVGAGAGSQSRAADCHLVLRQHEEDSAVVVEAAVRSWAPMQPFCLRWQFPAWLPADDLDPKDLRTAKSRKRPEATEETPEPAGLTKEQQNRLKVLEAYSMTPDGDTESRIRDAAGMNSRTFGPVQMALLRGKFVAPCQVKRSNGATYSGFKITPLGTAELGQLGQLGQEAEVRDVRHNSDSRPPLGGGVCPSSSDRGELRLPDFDSIPFGGQA